MIPTANRHAAERERLETVFRRYVKIAFVRPNMIMGTFTEHGQPAGMVLVAVEGNRKSIQILPDKPDPRRGLGW
jgi:hypothetical protein